MRPTSTPLSHASLSLSKIASEKAAETAASVRAWCAARCAIEDVAAVASVRVSERRDVMVSRRKEASNSSSLRRVSRGSGRPKEETSSDTIVVVR